MPTFADIFAVEIKFLPKSMQEPILLSGAIPDDVALLSNTDSGAQPIVLQVLRRHWGDEYFIYEPDAGGKYFSADRRVTSTIDFFKLAISMGRYGAESVSDLWMCTISRQNPYYADSDYDVYARVESPYSPGITYVRRRIEYPDEDNKIRLLVNDFIDSVAPGVDVLYSGDDGGMYRDMILFTLQKLQPPGVAVVGFRNWMCWRGPSGVVDSIRLKNGCPTYKVERAVDRLYAVLTNPLNVD